MTNLICMAVWWAGLVANEKPDPVAFFWHHPMWSCLCYWWTSPFDGEALNFWVRAHVAPHPYSCQHESIFSADTHGTGSDVFYQRRIDLLFSLCTHSSVIGVLNVWKSQHIHHKRIYHSVCLNCDRCTLCMAHRIKSDLGINRSRKWFWEYRRKKITIFWCGVFI